MIPKVIHYCWFGGKPLPKIARKCIQSWKRFCPDYEIVEWNEKNYDIHKNSYMEEAYLQKKWGFVPDFARLDIIYQNGGIYLDTDVELIRPLDELLYHRAYMGFEGERDGVV
ncbi:MAG: glycosyl transferase, partial [Lachnoanaerobaculum sp.]